MTPSPNCEVPGVEPPSSAPDQVLAAAVDLARAAATEEAGREPVGRHVGVQPESGGAATHLFEANYPGYGGWRWAVTVAMAGSDFPVTVSEVVLLPGPDALVAPEWVPWQQRVQAGDLGVGDLMPTPADDPRLEPAYLASDDPAVEEVAQDTGLGRVRVLSRFGRLDAADRWQAGEFGPRSDMARGAPDRCGRCGFYLPVAGVLRAAFGVCGNELAPADGHVVHVEYGCGAHSEVEVELVSPVPVVDLVYDDTTMDIEPMLSVQAAAEVAETTEIMEITTEPDEPVLSVEAAADVAVAEADEPMLLVEDAAEVAETTTESDEPMLSVEDAAEVAVAEADEPVLSVDAVVDVAVAEAEPAEPVRPTEDDVT